MSDEELFKNDPDLVSIKHYPPPPVYELPQGYHDDEDDIDRRVCELENMMYAMNATLLRMARPVPQAAAFDVPAVVRDVLAFYADRSNYNHKWNRVWGLGWLYAGRYKEMPSEVERDGGLKAIQALQAIRDQLLREMIEDKP